MYKPLVTDADLTRLKEERDRADRAYNEALTALDQALTRPVPLPGAPRPDTSQLGRLGGLWQVVPAEPVPFTGWRGRVGAFVWRVVGPLLQRQQEFNAALVDHANRSASSAGQLADAFEALSAGINREFNALAAVQSRLIGYLQQVTLYVDTKDRYEAGAVRFEAEHRAAGLAAGLSAVGDELLKRWERVLIKNQEFEARLAALRRAASQENRVEAPAGSRQVTTGAVGSPAAAATSRADVQAAALASRREDSAVYAGFEDAFRGPTDDIRERLGDYLPLFAGASDVLELGSGRGEFLQLLAANGISGRGIDINPEMVERCRRLGLDVVAGDGIEYLAALPDASLGGLFAAQVVEHLQPERLLQLLALGHQKLRPGAKIVLETVNPACWYAFFSSYIRDITHVRPVHPETLRYLLSACGFGETAIRYSSPYPRDDKLHPLPQTLRAANPAFGELVDEFNGNVEKLNELLFTYLDYAAVGTRAD